VRWLDTRHPLTPGSGTHPGTHRPEQNLEGALLFVEVANPLHDVIGFQLVDQRLDGPGVKAAEQD
jgi:hypothetical protein